MVSGIAGFFISLLNTLVLVRLVKKILSDGQCSRWGVGFTFFLKELLLIIITALIILKSNVSPVGFILGFSLPFLGVIAYGIIDGLKSY